MDANGKKYLSHIAEYEYDPWGRVLSVKDDSGRDISNESNDWDEKSIFKKSLVLLDDIQNMYIQKPSDRMTIP